MRLNYKKESMLRSYRTYIAGIAVIFLFLSNLTLIYLFYSERGNTKKMQILLEEKNSYFNKIHESLNDKDYQKAFRLLAEAKKHYLPAPTPTPDTLPQQQDLAQKRVAPPASVEPAKTLPTLAKESPAADEVPQTLVYSDSDEYALIVEKETKLLHVFRSFQGKITAFRQYPCIIGANNKDKKKDGDFATPIGVYFFLKYIPGSALPENYGHGAYVLNYPNFLDHKAGKKGSGIWLHGHSTGKTIGTEIPDTRGCVVVANDALKEMGGFIKPNGVPIAIVDRINYVKQVRQQELSTEVRNFLDSWRKAWESIDTKKYLSHYSSEFVNNEGMGYHAFRKHKERTNLSKKFIRVKMENLSLLVPPEYEGRIVVARFLQKYDSNNFRSDSRKIFYLEKGQKGWQIIGESLY